EWPFRPDLARYRLAFERNLAVGWNGKAGVGPADDVDRLAAQAAGDVKLAHLWQRTRRQHEQQRILTAQDHDLHRLPAFEILIAMDAAVLAFGDLAADRVAIIDLRAIGAEVEPAVIGVFGNDAIAGTDEARLVEFVMARYGKFQHVDFVAFEHVLQN